MRAFFLSCFGFLGLLSQASAQIRISEFLARNETGLRDEDGQVADWIEIENVSVEPVNLDGWTLTDNPDRLRKWDFPAIVLPAGERRVLFATSKDRQEAEGEWHTNFRLAAPGETLALVLPDGETIAHQIDAAPQFDDISYGVDGVTGSVGYLEDVTPGAENGGLVYGGPIISEVTHAPDPLLPGEDVVITVTVNEREAATSSVVLISAVGLGASSEEAMLDDGEGSDAVAGDGIYTAVIDGRTLFGERIKAGDMVRWAVLATDANGATSRLPAYLDREGVEQSPEYFGTVATSDLDTDLPVFEWFTNDTRNSRTRTGARASVAFMGRFYDNIYVRQRGGATNGQSQKFNFSNAFPCYVNEALPAVGELNLNAQGGDATHLRQPLAFESYTWIGNAACASFLTLMRLNADDDRTGVLIEQVDEDFLERHGFDPLGDLYKMVQRSNLNPVFADTTTGIEKKTGDLTDLSSIASLVEGLDKEGDELKAFLFDSINLPQVLNYLAVRCVTQDADDVRKNFYVYQDSLGNGEWSIFPWDKDWTFGVIGDGGQFLKYPFFGDQARRKDNANQWNKLYDAIFNQTATREMYLRRLRTVMDTILQPESTPEAELRYEARVDELFAQAQGDVSNSGASTVKRFFPERRRDLYETYDTLIPDAQVAMPRLAFGDIEFQLASGIQDEEYVQLINLNRTPVDLSGWTLEGGVEYTFAEGTVIGAGNVFTPGLNRLYVVPSVNVFRQRAASPTGGEGLFVQGPYDGHLSNRGETLTLKDREGTVIAEVSYEGNPSEVERFLVLSEIMYHPVAPNGAAEFIELYNVSETVTLDLTGVRFTDGIEFAFADGTMLEPNAYLVLVREEAAFREVYGEEIPIAGVFENQTRLANGGERLKLDDALNSTIFEVRYNDKAPWPEGADGLGASINLSHLMEGVDVETAESWQAGVGSPGQAASLEGGDFVDADGDGLVALLEEAFGTSDQDASQGMSAVTLTEESDRLVIRAPSGGSETIAVVLQTSETLTTWVDADSDSFLLTEETVGDQKFFVWRGARPTSEASFEAVRISANRL